MPLATLKRWFDGRLPNARSAHYVPRLERSLALTPGTLTDLLPFNVVSDGSNEESRSIGYRKRLKTATADAYAVKTPNERLRQEWAAFVEYKVAGSYVDPDDELSGRLKRSKSGQWFATNSTDVARTEANWYLFHGEQYVATANIIWGQTAQYLGWLMLPPQKGGKGLAAGSAMTLANLARGAWLQEYVRWKVQRAGGAFNGGTERFLKFAKSLCNPKTGYLTQTWMRFRDVTTDSQELWLQRCKASFEMLQDECRERSRTQVTSRDSFEPILHLLELDNPLEAVADMVIRMTACKPASGGVAEAVWARDILMVKLLMSNPIRDKNLRQLTFREDGTGQLRRAADGSWYIFIVSRELKNRDGAGKLDYNKPVHRDMWSDIEIYLRDYRPMLLKKDTHAVFLSARSGGPLGEKTLRRRFAYLTKRFLHRCPGVGPHSMRHLVATSILKQCPGDWHVAAETLHDEVETVREHYARFVKRDISRWQGRAMDGPFSRM